MRAVAIEHGFGWGGARSRLLPLPARYRRLRPDLAEGTWARLYVGVDPPDPIIEALRPLLAPSRADAPVGAAR